MNEDDIIAVPDDGAELGGETGARKQAEHGFLAVGGKAGSGESRLEEVKVVRRWTHCE